MIVVNARNAHQGLVEGLHRIKNEGRPRKSRNGGVLSFTVPYSTTYRQPRERVVFHPRRDANPFFHFFESLWMLAGQNDVATVEQFAANMREYSDDGLVFNAAYGYRWRRHFGTDQLATIVQALTDSPDCRRQVLGIWDPRHDLGLKSKDLPCNTQAYFQVSHEGALDMMVTNRSNDIVWGTYGANAVQFSVLLEYVASRIGRPVGLYHQVSMNTHLYTRRHEELMNDLAKEAPMPPEQWSCPYSRGEVTPFPLVNLPGGRWDRELKEFFIRGYSVNYVDPFFEDVAKPLLEAWQAHKARNYGRAKVAIMQCAASDWQRAGHEWLERREERWTRRSA